MATYELLAGESTVEPEKTIDELSHTIAEQLKTDIVLVNAAIEPNIDRELIQLCLSQRKYDNVLLILVTEGGSPDTAYRIARFLQRFYDKFWVFIPGYCKSAGTMIALGAHTIIVAAGGELGPLDIQLAKPDALLEQRSGLTVNEAFRSLKDKAFSMFEDWFVALQHKSSGRITTKTAAELATSLVCGLLNPVYAQIDPLDIGETERKSKIGWDYGKRLQIESKNFDDETLVKLLQAYPSHGFVIDCYETQALFKRVFAPSSELRELAITLGDVVVEPIYEKGKRIRAVAFLTGDSNPPNGSDVEDVPVEKGTPEQKGEQVENIQEGMDKEDGKNVA